MSSHTLLRFLQTVIRRRFKISTAALLKRKGVQMDEIPVIQTNVAFRSCYSVEWKWIKVLGTSAAAG